MPIENEILLESGTNELELLVFTLGDNRYGVNVAKVREAISPIPLTTIPESHPSVIGAFKLRDTVTTLIDLYRYFDLKNEEPAYDSRRIIVMEFNNTRIAFLVDTVEQIYRISWETVSPIPSIGTNETPVTSVCTIRDQMVLMIDFEKIVFDISRQDLFCLSEQTQNAPAGRNDVRILFAEDSSLMRQLISKNLIRAGYSNITCVEDGASAWTLLQKQINGEMPEPFSLLITDIEMPRLDGLALTRKVKGETQLANLPVVIFSSLVSPDNTKKIEQVKADGQMTKPELDGLVALIDRLLVTKGSAPAAAPSAAPKAETAREPVLT